jgi:DNA-binding GntR family transcriptional regulator
MPPAIEMPHIRKIDIPEARQAIPYLHAYLRGCILDGTLAPGMTLSQVSLAKQLGISRTPVREVLRMLQEEGLVKTEPNQRTRVTGLDPEEFDHDCASKILLEALAVSMTISDFGTASRKEARHLLTAMQRAAKTGDFGGWLATHADYHRIFTASGSAALQRHLLALDERTARYLRSYRLANPGSWQAASEAEDAQILKAVTLGDEHDVLTGMAHHQEHIALQLLTYWASEFVPVAVPNAVALIERFPPSAMRLTSAG